MAREIRREVFDVDIRDILQSLDYMDKIPAKLLDKIGDTVADAARTMLTEVFEEAIAQQDEDGFPQEFREHVLRVVGNMNVEKFNNQTEFQVAVDFNELGDGKDLSRAFHRHAILADGTELTDPYEDQQLKDEDDERRHLFWLAVRAGARKFIDDHGRHVPIEAGAWERTKQEYIQIWGNKAPEWLYLQFGQDMWEPTIEATDVMGVFTERFYDMATEIFYNALAQEVAEAQSHGTRVGTRPETYVRPYGRQTSVRDVFTGRYTTR